MKPISTVAIVLMTAGLLISGCSSSTPTTPHGAPPSPTAAAAGTSTAAVPTSTAAAAGATCKQLAFSDVQGLMTNPVTGDDVSSLGDGQQCTFHDSGNEQTVEVSVFLDTDPTYNYTAAKVAAASTAVAVPGVGDQALRQTGDFQVVADHGGIFCTVEVDEAEQIPGVKALPDPTGSLTLTEGQNGILAAALGTVCNRLYGTGNTTPVLSGLASAS